MSPFLPLTTAALIPLADAIDHDWDGGWWVVMALGMLIFWGIVIVGGVWLARELILKRSHRGGELAALEILDRRLAEGAISTEEYAERRRVLLDAAGRDESDG